MTICSKEIPEVFMFHSVQLAVLMMYQSFTELVFMMNHHLFAKLPFTMEPLITEEDLSQLKWVGPTKDSSQLLCLEFNH
jgi:hypothetical protein